MKVVTWNVNGIRARQQQVLELIASERPDIVCLQELKAKPEQIPAELAEMGGYWSYWHGAAAYSGVGLLIRRELCAASPAFGHPHFDSETRIVHADLGEWRVASVYVPNGGKDYLAKLEFLNEMQHYAAAVHASGRQLLVCGDLNVALTDRDVHPKERKPNAIGQRSDERELLSRVLGEGLVDIGRSLDPDNDDLFTWWAPWRNLRQRNIGWRIDYILASQPLAARARECRVLREHGSSDHGAIVATFGSLGTVP
jgi:exodeoxyribonuclease-3